LCTLFEVKPGYFAIAAEGIRKNIRLNTKDNKNNIFLIIESFQKKSNFR